MNDRAYVVGIDHIPFSETAGLVDGFIRWAATAQPAPERAVEVCCTGKPCQRCGILEPQTAADCDCDAMVRLNNQFSHTCSALYDVAVAAGGEYAVATGGDNILESLRQ